LNTSRAYCDELERALRLGTSARPARPETMPETMPKTMPETMTTILARGTATTPGKVAIADGTRQVTYRALEDISTRLARVLATRGVALEDRVAIVAQKECALVAGILGIVKAGAGYVPLDPASPPLRLRALVEDTAPRAMIGPAAYLAQLADAAPAGIPQITFEEIRRVLDGDAFAAEPGDVTLPEVGPGSLAYVMYTSGSTGRPKGVQIEHGAVIAFIEAHNEKLRVDAGARCMNTSPFHFDVSIMDTFLPLSVGATVHLTGSLPIRSALLGLIERERITHFCAVSSVLSLMTGDGRPLEGRDFSALRVVHFGGELCDVRVIERWRTAVAGLTMINGYGPTETTVVCVTHTIAPGDPTPVSFYPIGVPHRGTTLLLLDEAGNKLEATGAKGELYIGGNLLMRGYLARPEEDQRRMVSIDGAPYYKTGDICFRDPSGNYHFGGREDDEVKISGYRIHLSEVRGALLGVAGVAEGIVGPMERGESTRNALAAVVALERTPTLDAARALKAVLRDQLPGYMVPKYVLVCDTSLPRLPSGKTDEIRAMQLLDEAVKRWGVELYRFERETGAVEPLEDVKPQPAAAQAKAAQVSHG
jgi:amino acid adenylation domain-containing protein